MRPRALVVMALVCAASTNASPRVVHTPTLRSLCPAVAQWETMQTCIGRLAKPAIVRELGDAKLLRIPAGNQFTGLYLYRRHNSMWSFAGNLRLDDFEVLAFETTLQMIRVEVGSVMPTVVRDLAVEGTVRRTFLMVCSQKIADCEQVVTSCDMMVRGKAIWAYRGRPTVIAGKLHITGDASELAGDCGVSHEDRDIELQ